MSNHDEEKVTYFAETDSRNKRVPFGIKAKDRTRHIYVIGKTGMGKSTLLENMCIQDINNGNGLCFIDPHGKTADLFLDYVPESRIKDVLYFAPFDMEFPISFNVMEDVGPDRRHLVVSGGRGRVGDVCIGVVVVVVGVVVCVAFADNITPLGLGSAMLIPARRWW